VGSPPACCCCVVSFYMARRLRGFAFVLGEGFTGLASLFRDARFSCFCRVFVLICGRRSRAFFVLNSPFGFGTPISIPLIVEPISCHFPVLRQYPNYRFLKVTKGCGIPDQTVDFFCFRVGLGHIYICLYFLAFIPSSGIMTNTDEEIRSYVQS